MNEKILFVDDEENILSSYKRNLRKNFNVYTALGGLEGLNLIKSEGPFAVVVSDMQMPGMKGSEFLSEVNSISPDSVRIMLTGFANVNNAIDAVNEGHIFRFLTKPCDITTLVQTLNKGIQQYRLIHSEKELLEKTLRNSISVLTDILGLVNPAAFGRASRVKRYVIQIAKKLKLKDIWKLEMAAMLSQIGFVTLPTHILEKVYHQEDLSQKEQVMLSGHPAIGGQLIEKIPRLEGVAEIIRKQNMDYKEHNLNAKMSPGEKFVFLGAQILKVVLGFDEMTFRGVSKSAAIAMLKRDHQKFNPKIVDFLEHVQITEKERAIKTLSLDALEPGMIPCQSVMSFKGKMLIAGDTELTEPLIQRLNAYDRSIGVLQPFKVLV